MTDIAVELREGEQLMSDAEEIAYRQITPRMFIDNGQIASTAFGPNSSDNNMPSYSRSTLVSPQEARDWHNEYATSASQGVWGVTVGEVIASHSYVVDDSASPQEQGEIRAPGHCFVDFRGLTRAQRKELRAQLLLHALERGEIPTEPPVTEGQLF
ncbi:hypothetical protein ES689_14225 [Frigoribacterium sp. ACAM 257]|uniref:hypothetical protein n=1 Tax=Frigoribacterium sp. ACAM 257 TaxID=2508998 RepID=UPI0011BA2717|nr:hypothetical protein [Frigoribacterium sp. ACAM 257]TWX34995.1 hypothetical protein ES689_14225 [Frigoribacterium sp. ACAM 257]